MQESTVGFWLSPQQQFAWKLRQEVLKDCPWPACLVSLNGQVDGASIRRGLECIARRHEILRTSFQGKAGMKVPFQVVLEQARIAWEEVDYSSLSERERDLAVERLWNAQVPPKLTLEVQPTLKAVFAQLAKENFLLLLSVHPLCGDGPSLRVILAELAKICSGEENRLAEAFRYLQFAQWQTDLLEADDEDAQKGRDFWSKQLGSSHPVLPYLSGGEHPGCELQVVRRAVSPALASAILERSDGSQFLFAAWESLLYRLTGQTAFRLGFLAENREYAELENVVGCCSRTLPLGARLENDFRFADVLRHTQEWVDEARSLGECFSPEAIGMDGNLISFAYQDLGGQQECGGWGFRLERLQVTHEYSTLRLVGVRRGQELQLEFHYDRSRLEPAAVERIAVYYQNLLEQALASPETAVAHVPFLPESERRQLEVEWNQTAAPYPQHQCLHELFEDQAARLPERVALRSGERTYTYRQLNECANQLAHYLRQQGVGPDRPVGLCVERGTEMIVALLAILKAGGAYVPLNPDNPPARMQQQLHPLTALIIQSKFPMPDFTGLTVVLDRDQPCWANQPKSNPVSNTNPENLVYVIYTSGSTGVPKGVAVRHRNLVNYAHFITQSLDLELCPEGLQFATVSTLSADLGNTCIFPALISGGCLQVVGYELATDPRRLAQYLSKHPVDVLKIVPSHLETLLEAEEAASLLPRKYLILGGETLTKKLVDRILSLHPSCEVWNHYGPTETTVGSLILKLKEYDWGGAKLESIPLGRPIANTQVYILDQNLEAVAWGVAGELYIAGTGVTAGYLGQPEKSGERFVRNPFASDPEAKMYRTGDRARYGNDGKVEFLGRADDQVKIRGYRIELGEIEAVLRQNPAVKHAVVIARANERSEVRLLAYVVFDRQGDGEQAGGDGLRQYLQERLPDYMVPKVAVLGRLPLTANGKIDRQALPEPDEQAPARVQPRNELEQKLVKVWKEILSTEAIGVTDNFFDLGGHSLMAVRLVHQIKSVIGADIPLTALFQEATIEHLAGIIRGEASIPKAVAQAVQVGGSRPPLFMAVLAGKNALGYVPLAKRLGPEQPFYTLQSPGPGTHASKRTFSAEEYENVGHEYVRAMQAIQPKGPYYIGGYCEGARIAFEMTRILESQGESTNLLAILDTWVVENSQNRTLWCVNYYSHRLGELWRQPWHASLRAIGKSLHNHILWWTRSKSAPAKSKWVDIYWPGDNFVPKRIQGRITLFKLPKQPYYYKPDPFLGWGARTESGIDSYIIPNIIPNGKHWLILREPYVQGLATALSEALTKCQPASNVSAAAAEQPATYGKVVVGLDLDVGHKDLVTTR